MPAAILKLSEDRSKLEVVTPEGEEFEVEWPEDEVVVLEGDDGHNYVAILDGYEGLEPNTLYRLSKVETITEVLDDEDEGDEEEPTGLDATV